MFSLPFRTLLYREVMRFWIVKNQTVLTPLVTALLYLFIFGYSLGKKLTPFHNVPYIQFIIPGLMMMGIINNAYQNSASSLVISKYEKNILDILVAPLAYYEITLAYMFGGVIRGSLVGLIILLTSLFFSPLVIVNPIYSLTIILLSSSVFALFGIIAGVWAEKFDEMSRFNTFIILPFTYLGGVFYSVSVLPPLFQKLSYLNPLLYMVDGLRFGMLGVSDVNPSFSLLFIAGSAIILFIICLKIFRTGWKLRA